MERPTYTKVIGQDPISTATLFWILLLVFIWASNAVVVKVAVSYSADVNHTIIFGEKSAIGSQ